MRCTRRRSDRTDSVRRRHVSHPEVLENRQVLSALPAYDLIRQGLEDAASQRVTEAALLVAIGAERLRRAGVAVPDVTLENPEHALYVLLARENPSGAHSRYNALIRQLVSFERAAECAA